MLDIDNIIDLAIVDDYEPCADYDSTVDIQMCLNCAKPDCDNCLKTINGV